MSATSGNLRAVLVRAEGPNFCGGGDPAVMPNLAFDAFRVFITEYNRSYRALEALQVPTVAAVRGNVFGGGVELALSCDFIVAARDATIRQIEVSVGSMPMAGGVQRMADRIGCTRAALYAMLTLPMTGETAGELGFWRASSCPMRTSRARLLTSCGSLRTARRSATRQCGRSSKCGHQAASPGPMR